MESSSRDSLSSSAFNNPVIQLLTGRAFIAISILALVLVLAPYQAVLLFVVLGQAHFSLTYLDHFKKGRYSKKGALLYLIAALAAFSALTMSMNPFILFVSVFFLLHNFFDDMRLLKDQNRPYALLATAPLFILLSLASYDSLFSSDFLAVAALPLSLVFILIGIFLASQKAIRSHPYILYILGISALLMTTYNLFPEIGAERLFAFIILSHYFNWYWHIYKKYEPSAARQRSAYVRECLIVNGIIITVFSGFLIAYGGMENAIGHPLYTLVYTPYYFYAWTLMHLLVTLRGEDYGVRVAPKTALF